MKQSNMRWAALMVTSALVNGAPAIAQSDDLATAITSGEANLVLRHRYEFVDQDGFDKDANASTLLMRLNYKTGSWNGWSSFLEFDHVLELGLDNFNSGGGTSSPRRGRYPVVADPTGSDFNQFYLQYAGSDDWRIRVGRQRILLDDQRYVGGVGWRQNEQTYDSVSLQHDGIENLNFFYSYVTNVNRIFGDDVAAGDHDQDTHLVNAKYTLNDQWNAIGYAYLIDNDDSPGFSTDTFGLRVNGKVDLGTGKLALLGDFATQSDAGNAPVDYDTEYFRLQGIWSLDALSLGVGFESLGSDNGQGFRTPLATLHAFNGWADQFLSTPADGLEDFYLRAGYKVSGWNLLALYHDFSAETGGADFGQEVNISAARKFGKRYNLLLKSAFFDGDDGRGDTTKFWMMWTAKF